MDLKNLECTSTYAIEAVYREYWHLIPEKYRILEKQKEMTMVLMKKMSMMTK